MQISDDIMLGPVFPGGSLAAQGGPSPMERGVGPMGRVYVWDVVPLALALANIAALQTTAGAGNLVLTAAAGVTASVDPTGVTRYTLDTPRCVSLTSAGNISAVNFTVTGYDQYGQSMTQLLAGPNANTVSTTKAFSSIISVAASAAVGTNTSVGTTDKLGLPYAATNVAYVSSVKWNSTLAQDAGTFVAADGTNPATSATGDVRGTYLPSNATDGVKRLVMVLALPGIASGPNATRIGAVGVANA